MRDELMKLAQEGLDKLAQVRAVELLHLAAQGLEKEAGIAEKLTALLRRGRGALSEYGKNITGSRIRPAQEAASTAADEVFLRSIRDLGNPKVSPRALTWEDSRLIAAEQALVAAQKAKLKARLATGGAVVGAVGGGIGLHALLKKKQEAA